VAVEQDNAFGNERIGLTRLGRIGRIADNADPLSQIATKVEAGPRRHEVNDLAFVVGQSVGGQIPP
jgi:hypothetical protein